MTELLIILAAAATALALAHWLRLPSIPFLVAAGIGLTSFGTLPDRDLLESMLMLGLTFLVFSGGLELNPSRLFGPHRKAALGVALAQFIVLGSLGLATGKAFGFTWLEASYLAIAVAASSTIVVVRILQQRRQYFESFGRLVLAVLLLQDLVTVLLIAGLNRATDGITAVGLSLLATLGLMVLAGVFNRWVSPWLLARRDMDQEMTLLVSLAILFFFIGLAHWLALPLPVGAFLAGVALSGFPVNGLIRGQIHSLSLFFMTLFFVLLGATLSWPDMNKMLTVIVLVVMVVTVTPVIVLIVAQRLGLSTRNALESGLLLAQCSEFSIIVVLLGVSQGHVDDTILLTVAMLTVVSMALTPFIATDNFTWGLIHYYTGRRKITPIDREGHVLMIGCGTNSRVLLDLLLLAGREVVVIEEDPAVVDRLSKRGILAIQGNGADVRVLRAAHARHARVIVSTMRRVEDNQRLMRIARDVPVFIRVFETADAHALKDLGATPILESDAGAEDVMLWINKHYPTSSPARVMNPPF